MFGLRTTLFSGVGVDKEGFSFLVIGLFLRLSDLLDLARLFRLRLLGFYFIWFKLVFKKVIWWILNLWLIRFVLLDVGTFVDLSKPFSEFLNDFFWDVCEIGPSWFEILKQIDPFSQGCFFLFKNVGMGFILSLFLNFSVCVMLFSQMMQGLLTYHQLHDDFKFVFEFFFENLFAHPPLQFQIAKTLKIRNFYLFLNILQ